MHRTQHALQRSHQLYEHEVLMQEQVPRSITAINRIVEAAYCLVMHQFPCKSRTALYSCLSPCTVSEKTAYFCVCKRETPAQVNHPIVRDAPPACSAVCALTM